MFLQKINAKTSFSSPVLFFENVFLKRFLKSSRSKKFLLEKKTFSPSWTGFGFSVWLV